MALHIGFNCAKEIINNSMGSSFDTVATYWRTNPADDIGYLLAGYPRNLVASTATPQMYWFAAFSTARMTELATNAPPTAIMTTRSTVDNQSMFSNTISTFMAGLTNFGANGSTNIELIGHTAANPRISPPVGWMTIKQPVRTTPGKTNTVSTPVMRIAFFTEDLSGLIDAERMCGSTTRDTGTNPTEISMTNIGPTPGISFGTATNTRATYLSPFLLASNGGIATTNLRYFATGLRSWTNAVERIPRAIAIAANKCYGGATNSNGAKFLIPTNPTTNDVAKIAAALTTNLPNFGARGGGMNSGAYISNIAANIVDYIDTDDIPTTDSATSPTYIGIENIPWPNELFDNLQFANVLWSKQMLVIDVEDKVEVWNMGNKSIPASTNQNSMISISNNYDLVLTFTNTLLGVSTNVNLKDMVTQDAGTVWPRYRYYSNPAIPPNGYAVLSSWKDNPSDKYGQTTVAFTGPAIWFPSTNASGRTAISSSWYVYPAQTNATTNMQYTAQYNGKVIQQSKDGRWTRYLAPSFKMGNNNLGVSPNQYVFLNPIGLASQTTISGVPAHSGGDPRAQYFLSGPLRNHNYVNSYASPGGRNVERFNISSFPESEVNPAKFWPDSGHATNSEWGGNPTQYSDDPSSYTTTAQTNNWVMACRPTNQTGLVSLKELGRIYDPMQWSDQSGSGVANQPGLWTNLTTAASPDARFGGRNTLRIGRPEFSRFAFTNLGGATGLPIPNMGQSAAALLDIFRTTTNGIDDGGKININTAPGPVLAALAGGISLKSDLAKVGTEVNSNMVAAFTNGVMKFRQTYPFYSTSQLPFISTNYGAANWTNSWLASAVFSTNPGCGLNGITELNDQGMEEWFSKIYGLSTVQSRNFRIYVYAQMVNSNNVPYGRIMRKYYHLYTEQTSEGPTELFNDAGYSMVPERESEY